MPTIDVFNTGREKVASVDLDDTVFGGEVKEHLLYSAVRYQMAARRAGTHKVKGRAEVSGSGKKPFKQKGTGRARAGHKRSPIWRGGGVVFGPTPRSYAFKLNKKVHHENPEGVMKVKLHVKAQHARRSAGSGRSSSVTSPPIII